MFIVVEGPDGSGKSSLVSALHDAAASRWPDRSVVSFHMGKPEEETREWCLRQWATSIETTDWSDGLIGIADRWHWGEVTYAPLKRPHTCKDEYGLLGLPGWRLVELALLSRGVVQFVVLQPIEVLQRRIAARGDDFVDVSELERIRKLYLGGIEKSARVEIITPPDGDMDALPGVAERMLLIASERERETRNLALFPEYIGGPRPSVLLVGDRRNNQVGTPIMPFFPVNSNSGDYLLSCLPDPFWKSVGIVNGSEVCGGRLLLLWETLGRPRIVALGRLAEKSIRNDMIPKDVVNVAPHPQYVRRFHHHDREEYGLAIERLSGNIREDRWILR